jgi:hypothetical protein
LENTGTRFPIVGILFPARVGGRDNPEHGRALDGRERLRRRGPAKQCESLTLSVMDISFP